MLPKKGDAFQCSKESCTCRSASLRYCSPFDCTLFSLSVHRFFIYNLSMNVGTSLASGQRMGARWSTWCSLETLLEIWLENQAMYWERSPKRPRARPTTWSATPHLTWQHRGIIVSTGVEVPTRYPLCAQPLSRRAAPQLMQPCRISVPYTKSRRWHVYTIPFFPIDAPSDGSGALIDNRN